jgi:hypothetical protein
MTCHYEWDNTEEESAMYTFHLCRLLEKLNVGYKSVSVTQTHVMDVTLTIHYKDLPTFH